MPTTPVPVVRALNFPATPTSTPSGTPTQSPPRALSPHIPPLFLSPKPPTTVIHSSNKHLNPTLSTPPAIPSCLQQPVDLQPLRAQLTAYTTELSRVRQMFVVEAQRVRAANAAERRAAGKGGVREEGEDCPICLERLVAPGCTLTRCGHMFHKHCILQHLSKEGCGGGGECPICRRSLYGAELVDVMSGIPQGVEHEEEEFVEEGKFTQVGEGEWSLEEGIARVTGEVAKLEGIAKVGEKWEGEIERMWRMWEEEVGKMRESLEEEKMGVRGERSKLEQARMDCLHERGELKSRMDEVNEQIADMIRRKRELVEAQQNAKRKETELMTDKQRFEDEKLNMRRTRDRLEALIVAKGEGERGRDLKRENERLRREIRRLKEEDEERRERAGSEEGIRKDDSAFTLVFGDKLQKPSSLNRPKAPRRAGGALSGWVPKKARVQRPGAGIGERKG